VGRNVTPAVGTFVWNGPLPASENFVFFEQQTEKEVFVLGYVAI
jgi:hypothetical protein